MARLCARMASEKTDHVRMTEKQTESKKTDHVRRVAEQPIPEVVPEWLTVPDRGWLVDRDGTGEADNALPIGMVGNGMVAGRQQRLADRIGRESAVRPSGLRSRLFCADTRRMTRTDWILLTLLAAAMAVWIYVGGEMLSMALVA